MILNGALLPLIPPFPQPGKWTTALATIPVCTLAYQNKPHQTKVYTVSNQSLKQEKKHVYYMVAQKKDNSMCCAEPGTQYHRPASHHTLFRQTHRDNGTWFWVRGVSTIIFIERDNNKNARGTRSRSGGH